MKSLLFTIAFFVTSINAFAQPTLNVTELSLPPEFSERENQFSGLFISDNRLWIMSESRLQDNAEPKLYTINLTDLKQKLSDSSYVLPYKKIIITGMENLRKRMIEAGSDFEGMEAIAINGSEIYLSVETPTPAPVCYFLKGLLSNDTLKMTDMLVQINKPRTADGKPIYNAGFEAMALHKNDLLAFYEYNFFEGKNFAYYYHTESKKQTTVAMQNLPFRITDITRIGKNKYVGINYFYNGPGPDTIYRIPLNNPLNSIIKQGENYKSYVRLISLKVKKNKITWKSYANIPEKYWAYNWEGIANWEGGFFMINDKYTPARPYRSVLLYMKK